MQVQVCHDLDQETGQCLALEWIDAAELVQAASEPWLDVPGALLIAGAIGTLWAAAWAIRAIAQQLHSFITLR